MILSILGQFPSNLFSIRFVSVHLVHPYIDTTAAWKKLRFILSDMFDFHMIDNRSLAVHAFASLKLMSFLVDEILPPMLVNFSTNFKEPTYSVEMSPIFSFLIKAHLLSHTHSCISFVLFVFLLLSHYINYTCYTSVWYQFFCLSVVLLVRFLKCSFPFCILSSWLTAFSFGLKELFPRLYSLRCYS